MALGDHTDTHLAERLIGTPNGSIFVSERPGDEPAVVLLHGFPDDHRVYDKLQSALTPRRSISFDYLGYGRSDRPNRDKIFHRDHEVELSSVFASLGIDEAILVGHDASGPDAVLYAIGHPQQVAHVVLLNTYFGHLPSMKMPEMTRLFSDPQLARLVNDLVNDPNQLLWFLTRWGKQMGLDSDVVVESILAQFVGDENQPNARTAIRAWTAALQAELSQQDLIIESGALRDLQVPVSLIFGEDDPDLTPALGGELAALFKNAPLHIVSDAHHYVQDDQADAVADFVKRI